MVTDRVYYLIYLYTPTNQASVLPKQQERLQLDRLTNQLSDAIQRYGAVQKVRLLLASTLPCVFGNMLSVEHLHEAGHT